MVQRLRTLLTLQGARVRSLAQEDSTGRRATKPVHPQLLSPQAATREATAREGVSTATESSSCLPQLEKARRRQRRPRAAKDERKTEMGKNVGRRGGVYIDNGMLLSRKRE